MRIMLLGIAFLLAMPVLQAQDKIDAFGKIEKADLEMKTCDFDPDAEAYCLLDVADVSYNITTHSVDIVTNFRKRIKILKDGGKGYANVKIRYYSKDRYERLSNISGMVYNLDDAGNVVATKLEKSLIYDKQIDSRYSEVSFALPDVKTGSVIEYKYKSYKENSYSDIDDWYFQSNIPVRYSAYNLLIPSYFDFTFQIVRRQEMQHIKSKHETEGDWFIMRNIPSLKHEPYMAAYNDYLQRVDFQLSGINVPGRNPVSLRTTWLKLAEELDEAEWFGKQIKKNVPGTSAPLKALLADAKSEKEKIQIIYKFVQTNMSWNGNNARGSYDGIKDAWDKKSGTTGDINLLLVNLLRDNRITAYPTLVSTRDNGKVNTIFPFLGQFNAVYVYAETKNQDAFIMNAADKYNPYDLYPYDVQLTEAFIVDTKNGGMMEIQDLQKKLRHNINVLLRVEDNGEVNGDARISSFEYARNIRRKTYKDNSLREFYEDNEGIKLKVDSFNVQNDLVDSLPLEQRVYFKGNMQMSDDYGFLPYNLFSGLGKNPFVAENRSSDIDFGFAQSYNINGSIALSPTMEFDELPKNLRMILPDTSIMLVRIMQKTDNILNFRVNIDFLRAQYAAEEYPDVKEVYKKIFAILNEHIVIKKKKV